MKIKNKFIIINKCLHLYWWTYAKNMVLLQKGCFHQINIDISQRTCKYCSHMIGPDEPNIDDELHFINKWKAFLVSRNCLFGKLSSLDPLFLNLTENQKFERLLNPKTCKEIKLVNKFIKIMFDWRDKIDKGFSIANLSIYFAQ